MQSKLDAGQMGIKHARTLLGWSMHHVRWILARYRNAGMLGVVHGNTGRAPVNGTPEHFRRLVKALDIP